MFEFLGGEGVRACGKRAREGGPELTGMEARMNSLSPQEFK